MTHSKIIFRFISNNYYHSITIPAIWKFALFTSRAHRSTNAVRPHLIFLCFCSNPCLGILNKFRFVLATDTHVIPEISIQILTKKVQHLKKVKRFRLLKIFLKRNCKILLTFCVLSLSVSTARSRFVTENFKKI